MSIRLWLNEHLKRRVELLLEKILRSFLRKKYSFLQNEEIVKCKGELENRVRELEVDVTVKERIKLEKGEVRIITEKIKELEKKEQEFFFTKKTRISQVKERKNEEIYEYIRDVGYVEKITVKRCYKYKTVKTRLHFTKEYENTYARGGANITIFRNSHQYFFIMFDSDLMTQELKGKYRSEVLNSEIIKENIKKYGGFFGKIIRVNKIKYILIYFNNKNDMMKGMNDDIGSGLQLKSQDKLIRKNGGFKPQIIKTQPNNKVSEKSVDEQYYDTRENLTDPLTNDQNKSFE
ncbi:hypothetical protein RhiirA1_453977 [Rhizophagus irregularis]|uniref:Uncharacterized protein n=1 Tax=Rhizophagus irregularis TaxID=588596 RepID=A0A2N0S694_9GLOM|nr:hypothetical protein RhiirA1_453977 [Rhizophagus irregularis]